MVWESAALRPRLLLSTSPLTRETLLVREVAKKVDLFGTAADCFTNYRDSVQREQGNLRIPTLGSFLLHV